MVGTHSRLQKAHVFAEEVTVDPALEGRGPPFRAGGKAIPGRRKSTYKAGGTDKCCLVRDSACSPVANPGAHVVTSGGGADKGAERERPV